MATFEEQCVSVYRDVGTIPSLESVDVVQDLQNENILHFEAVWSQRDLERSAKLTYRKTGIVTRDEETLSTMVSPITTEIAKEKMVRISNCGTKRAILREACIKNKDQQYLEIWNSSKRILTVDFASEDKHGAVHSNAVFNCMEWSNDGTKLLYVAEKKLPKGVSYFKKKCEENEVKGDESLLREEWGEQLLGCHHPTLFVFDLATSVITALHDKFPENFSISTAVWSNDDKNVIALGWDGSPWKLGLIYCQNRPSSLFILSFELGTSKKITPDGICVYSPFLKPDESKVFYLQTESFGPHKQCARLMEMDVLNKGLDFGEPRTVVDTVHKGNATFSGLYMDQISKKCWLKNGKEVLFHTNHCSYVSIFSLNVETGTVKSLATGGSWSVLAVCNDVVFASFSSPNSPPLFRVGTLGETGSIQWIEVDIPTPAFSDISWKVNQHQPIVENPKYLNIFYESVLIQPEIETLKGLIINPHGGPHGCYSAAFDIQSVAMCKLGFAVLRINFRGSIGFGQDSIYSLPGNISRQDVSDVQQAAEFAVKELSMQNGQIFVTGGSHGGFLTLQMLGQFPDYYSAGAARNPVSNIVSMTAVTDIRDWTFCEAGYQFEYGKVGTGEMYKAMLDVSPIKYVDQVKSPLMMLLGERDIRVPICQSHEYVRALRARGNVVRLLQYPDNDHPIAKVKDEADCFVNIAVWFNRFCKTY